MTQIAEELELKERLNLIESMIAEGRRTTESWGWICVLWGVAYYVAIAWSAWGVHDSTAWPVTMCVALILMFAIIAWRASGGRRNSQPATTLTRAVSAVWIAVGTSFFVLLPSLGMAGRSSSNLVVAIIGTLLGTANAASGIILKWKLQLACALIWWATAIISCFGTTRQSFIALLVANFLCQIVFGLYGMSCETRKRRLGAVHA
jgi:hypothetical protein